MEFGSRERRFSIPDPYLPGEMTVSLIVEGEIQDRLQKAFCEAVGEKALQLTASAPPKGEPVKAGRWCVCVAPDVGRQLKLEGWRDGLIFVMGQEDFPYRPLLGPRDVLLFHDVAPVRLPAAVRLAIAGMTLFPSEHVPIGEMAGPALKGFQELSDADRGVMAELARGLRDREIANRLGRSAKSVRQSIERIFRKFGCANRLEIVLLAHSRFSPFLNWQEARSNPAWSISGHA